MVSFSKTTGYNVGALSKIHLYQPDSEFDLNLKLFMCTLYSDMFDLNLKLPLYSLLRR